MSLNRGDSTYNLLMDLSPPEVVEPSSDGGGGGGGGGSNAGSSSGLTSSPQTLSGGNRLQKQSRPLLTAPSFEQRPPELRDSPWSSTDTSCRSRKSSGAQELCMASTNNNTLAIAIGNSITRQCTPPSQSSVESNSNRNRSVPDIELHYRRGHSDDRASIVTGESPRLYNRHVSPSSFSHHHHYHHHHNHANPSRPRVCEHQPFSFSLSRATSRESVRSIQPGSTNDSLQLPVAGILTPQPSRESRGMLRQHSHPETSCFHCQVTTASSSLRQLKEVNSGDAIAGIAADTLRINGAIRQFRQVAFPVGHSILFLFLSSNLCAIFQSFFRSLSVLVFLSVICGHSVLALNRAFVARTLMVHSWQLTESVSFRWHLYHVRMVVYVVGKWDEITGCGQSACCASRRIEAVLVLASEDQQGADNRIAPVVEPRCAVKGVASRASHGIGSG